MKKTTIKYFFFSLLLYSCTETIIVQQDSQKNIEKISISVSSPSSTRLFVKDDNYNMMNMNVQNYIENSDTIGIFPSEGDQIPFIIENLPAPQTSFTFQSKGWGLKSGIEYFAYMPFNRTENFKNYNNVESIYVNYFGQHMDQDMTDSNIQYDMLNYSGKSQSMYSYMYSEPAQDLSGSGNLMFQLRYLGGWVFVYCYFPSSSYFPTGYNTSNTTFILAKLVASKPIFRAEGNYNLKQAGTNRVSGTHVLPSDIIPTKRGLTNVLSVQLDSVKCGMWDDLMLSFAIPPVNFSELIDGTPTTCTIYLYDTNANYYLPYDGNYVYNALAGPVEDGTGYFYSSDFKYCGKATPEDLKVEPWDSIPEIVNSNWNYK